MAAGVGVAAGGDEEGEVEEPGGGCASARAKLWRKWEDEVVDLHHDPCARAPHHDHDTNMSNQSIK